MRVRAMGGAGWLLVAGLLAAPAPAAQSTGPALPDYDLGHPSGLFPLPRGLAEVSGLAADGEGGVWAHDDELAVLYRLNPADGGLRERFGVGRPLRSGDFEGVALADGRLWLVTSGGTLSSFERGSDGGRVRPRSLRTALGRVCEVEGLAWDDRTRALLLPCKTVAGRRRGNRIVVFAYSVDRREFEPEPRVEIPFTRLEELGVDGELHPSAIEVHPATGTYWILGGREETLVEVARDGRLLAARRLPRQLHRQPEGLAFTADLQLLVADEGAGGAGTLVRYAFVGPPWGRR